MADSVALRYRNRDVVFEKNTILIAVRARAGMEPAMQVDVDSVAVARGGGQARAIGGFELVELKPSASGLEQALDWLRARPAVAAASHVFSIRGETALMVPDGNVHLRFGRGISDDRQQRLLTRYRLQATERRGDGEFLVRITSGSKNPIDTAAALQAEPSVSLAEPEFARAASKLP